MDYNDFLSLQMGKVVQSHNSLLLLSVSAVQLSFLGLTPGSLPD